MTSNSKTNGTANGTRYSNPNYKSIDDVRPVKIICIGAGVSGILTAIRFPQHIQNLELVIYEKNEDVGGTWFENRYPGIACDVPAGTYQFTFASNPQWSKYYAPGGEIQQYLKNVCRRYDVLRYVKFRQQFKGARWLAEKGKWEVTIESLTTSTVRDFLAHLSKLSTLTESNPC
jgi:cation diffusion facilitator CzcD-associated flavoprotein CzcO